MNIKAPVVVGYDGSADSLAALGWAAKMASLRGEGIIAVTTVDPRETPRGTAWPASWWEEVEDEARKVLAPWPDVPVTIERHVGHKVPRLVEAADAGSMLVVGSVGHGLVGEILLGSVSQSAARHAAVPVVVIRPAQNAAAGRIVVGADDSDSSNRALQFACEMARVTGDKVVVLHAWTARSIVAGGHGYMPPIELDSMPDAESTLSRIVDRLRAENQDVDIEGEIYHGSAERGLVDASANSSLVVVGSRGHGVIGETLLGSVSHDVLHRAHCPIAVVH
jgi:nucleotide-binding universal stress UspA family protein